MPDELTPSAAAQELQRLCDAATPGPWGTDDDTNPHLVTCGKDFEGAFLYVANASWHNDYANAAFIAACRNLLPILLRERQELIERINKLEKKS